MEISFEIGEMRAPTTQGKYGDVLLAEFDVDMYPFRIAGCCVRRDRAGRHFVSIPGRGRPGMTIIAPELATAIRDEALAVWRARGEGSEQRADSLDRRGCIPPDNP